MAIYFYSDASPFPGGGLKKIYDQVDILNNNGFESYVMHNNIADFRAEWFPNNTQIVYSPKLKEKDIVVLTEADIAHIHEFLHNRVVIYNQACYQTFESNNFIYTILQPNLLFYRQDNIRAIMTVSEDSKTYLSLCFPHLYVHRIYHEIDPYKFRYNPNKKKNIAFLVTKNMGHIRQVISILKLRHALEGWNLVPIYNFTEEQIRQTLWDAAVFLSFSSHEGFGLLSAEAMACGCIVIGYDGFGGREFFRKSHCYPVPCGDVTCFVKKVHRVLNQYQRDAGQFKDLTEKASRFILDTYQRDKQVNSIINFWREYIKKEYENESKQ